MKEKTKLIFNNYLGEERTKEIFEKCQFEFNGNFYLDGFKVMKELNETDILTTLDKIAGDNFDDFMFLQEVVRNPEAVGFNTMVIDTDGSVTYTNETNI